ncbi:LacI family DNA-binding transcriptional regulator [Halobacillus sp. A5]|nr:LacI family DNA-binding transcriptional regulator [Halobacillus sp. A5]
MKLGDVTKAAGFSPTTVSRVLNNRGFFKENEDWKAYLLVMILSRSG